MLRPFAVADPGALYEVHWLGKDRSVRMHSWRDYEEIRARRDVFADALASRGVFVVGITRHWSGKLVSGNYFRMLGAHIEFGRPIEDRDTQTPLGDNVVVLGYDAWKSAYQLDPGVLGKQLVLRGHTYEIIGVAGREFAGLDESPPDFWAPISMHAAFRKEEMAVEVIGRLRDGVSKAQAEAALAGLATQDRADMRAELGSRATVMAFTPMMLVFFSPVLAALGLVLATCCANVANMLLARGLARQREIGIRLSVGAGRARLVRQLLTEALVISVLAGVAGIVLARLAMDGGLRVFFATTAPEFSKLVRLHSLDPDYRVFLFAFCAAMAAAMGAALVPALQATRPDLVSALRGEFGTAFRASRLRDGLVVLQVVVCAVLLVCGVLLYRRASVFQAQDTGMRQQGVINLSTEDRGVQIAAELRSLPDVEAVGGIPACAVVWPLQSDLGRPIRPTEPANGKLQLRLAGLFPRLRYRFEKRPRLHRGGSPRRSTGSHRQPGNGTRILARRGPHRKDTARGRGAGSGTWTACPSRATYALWEWPPTSSTAGFLRAATAPASICRSPRRTPPKAGKCSCSFAAAKAPDSATCVRDSPRFGPISPATPFP